MSNRKKILSGCFALVIGLSVAVPMRASADEYNHHPDAYNHHANEYNHPNEHIGISGVGTIIKTITAHMLRPGMPMVSADTFRPMARAW